MSIGHFLGGIGACIYDPHKKKYLILRRADQRDYGANQWECLTGRVDQGESYTQALHREVQEEIGVQVHIEYILGTAHFYRGEKNPNNELLGVIYACTIQSQQKPSLGEEHSEFRWVSAEEAYALIPKGNWLYNVIRKAETIRLLISSELLQFYQKEGFDI